VDRRETVLHHAVSNLVGGGRREINKAGRKEKRKQEREEYKKINRNDR
jgi:hypothetical protein